MMDLGFSQMKIKKKLKHKKNNKFIIYIILKKKE